MNADRYADLICPVHAQVFIDKPEYNRQMAIPGVSWRCQEIVGPDETCDNPCEFDEEYWLETFREAARQYEDY